MIRLNHVKRLLVWLIYNLHVHSGWTEPPGIPLRKLTLLEYKGIELGVLQCFLFLNVHWLFWFLKENDGPWFCFSITLVTRAFRGDMGVYSLSPLADFVAKLLVWNSLIVKVWIGSHLTTMQIIRNCSRLIEVMPSISSHMSLLPPKLTLILAFPFTVSKKMPAKEIPAETGKVFPLADLTTLLSWEWAHTSNRW